MNKKKLLKKLIQSQKNFKFSDAKLIIEAFGFKLIRINGSHHIFNNSNVDKLINLQEVKGQAKPYQLKQFIKIIEKYNLHMEE